MNISLVHGADRNSVFTGADSPGVVPFHQVVSKGMLRAADEQHFDPREWQELSPMVDRALEGKSVTRTSRLDAWTELGKAAGTLSFAESTRCALEFVGMYGASICQALVPSDTAPAADA